MTLLEIVNSVLRRLREPTVADLSDEYARLVADFVADTHKEVVDAHDWTKMDRGILITVTPGTTQYDVGVGSTSLYSGWTGLGRGAQLRYGEDGMPVAYLYETITDQNYNRPCASLAEGSEARINQSILEGRGQQAQPSEFSFIPDHPDYDGPALRVNCNPDATYYMYVRCHDPEAEIDPDTDVAREIAAPSRPLILGATYLALNERGEELGEPGSLAETRYRIALAAEIERDRLRLGRTNQYEMVRD
jgi:hypothetical protein